MVMHNDGIIGRIIQANWEQRMNSSLKIDKNKNVQGITEEANCLKIYTQAKS